jgi:hypothetical protein
MFKLRKEHLEAFSELALDGFLDRGVVHLRQSFPQQTQSATDTNLRGWIQSCIPRAASYGLESQYAVMCFVDATFLLGADFDRDPQHACAADLLQDTTKDADDRAEELLQESRRRR